MKTINATKLSLISLCLLGVVGLCFRNPFAQQGSVRKSRTPEDVAFWEKQLQNPMVKGNLRSDDGFAAAIFYGGNILGNLELCG